MYQPDVIETYEVDGEVLASIGFEEVGGVATFDVTDPETPSFVDYINTRDFGVDPETEIEDDDQPATSRRRG